MAADFPADQTRLLKQLVSRFRCSVCRRTFDREQVRVAARHEQVWIVSVRCTRCRDLQVFCFVPRETVDDTGPRDMSDAEAERFAAMEPVSYDEVLAMYEFLMAFDGDFQRLFAT